MKIDLSKVRLEEENTGLISFWMQEAFIVPRDFDEKRTYELFRQDNEVVGVMLEGHVIAWKRAYESEN